MNIKIVLIFLHVNCAPRWQTAVGGLLTVSRILSMSRKLLLIITDQLGVVILKATITFFSRIFHTSWDIPSVWNRLELPYLMFSDFCFIAFCRIVYLYLDNAVLNNWLSTLKVNHVLFLRGRVVSPVHRQFDNFFPWRLNVYSVRL